MRGRGGIASDRWWGSALKPHSADPPCMQPQAPAAVAVATGYGAGQGLGATCTRGFGNTKSTTIRPTNASHEISSHLLPPSRCIAPSADLQLAGLIFLRQLLIFLAFSWRCADPSHPFFVLRALQIRAWACKQQTHLTASCRAEAARHCGHSKTPPQPISRAD